MKKLPSTLKEFSEKQEMLRLAFVDQSGQPKVVPVWYVIIGTALYVGTGSESAKWRAIQRDPRVGWVIDGGKKGKYKGVSMYGKAEEVTDRKLRVKLYRAFGEKYFGSDSHPKHIEIWGDVDDPGSVYLRLRHDDGFWWEY